MSSCEQATALEFPEVRQSTSEKNFAQETNVEQFLDPLFFQWNEEQFIVSEAVRSYVAQFDADY